MHSWSPCSARATQIYSTVGLLLALFILSIRATRTIRASVLRTVTVFCTRLRRTLRYSLPGLAGAA